MSNYAQTTFFGPKDSLNSGDPTKVIHGTQVDTELANVAAAIASKYDASSIAGITLPFGNGAVNAPSITFNSETTTGFYRPAADTIGISINGTEVASIAATVLTLLGSTSLVVGGSATVGGTLGVTGAVTGGTYNGQTISSAASLTGTLSVAGALNVLAGGSSIKGGLTIGTPASGVALVINGATNTRVLTLLGSGVGSYFQINRDATAAGYIGSADSVISGGATTDFGVVANSGLSFGVNGSQQALYITTGKLVQAIDDSGTMQVVGWRGTPFNTQVGNYTLVLADRGKSVEMDTASTTLTVPASVFNTGDVVTVIANLGSGAITIAQGAGMSLFWANASGGVTGNRTLTGVGIATVIFASPTAAFITGAGLS